MERLLPVLDPGLSVEEYRRLLERLYGFHAPLEAHLAALSEWQEAGFPLGPRLKCPLLRRDLLGLGLSPIELSALAGCDALPQLDSFPRALGCLYVLEGATLGGQVISRHLARLDPEIAAHHAFFRGYGARTGAMWLAFRALLVRSVPPTTETETVEAARETFQAFERWMS